LTTLNHANIISKKKYLSQLTKIVKNPILLNDDFEYFKNICKIFINKMKYQYFTTKLHCSKLNKYELRNFSIKQNKSSIFIIMMTMIELRDTNLGDFILNNVPLIKKIAASSVNRNIINILLRALRTDLINLRSRKIIYLIFINEIQNFNRLKFSYRDPITKILNNSNKEETGNIKCLVCDKYKNIPIVSCGKCKMSVSCIKCYTTLSKEEPNNYICIGCK
jgi:hypothetical protein